jgi:hypothetical protein
MQGSELEARLREWARLSAAPLVVPPKGPPPADEVARRLREATDLWVACARLATVGSPLAEARGPGARRPREPAETSGPAPMAECLEGGER